MNRFDPLYFKNHKFSKNRVVVPPMASETASELGYATNKTLEHYKRLSLSGAGIIFVEYTYVHQSGRSETHQLGLTSYSQAASIAPLAQIIKTSGALAFLQLTHSGGKSDIELTQGNLMGPSGLTVPSIKGEFPVPRVMNIDDIALWKSSFLNAARLAHQMGYDGVELHSAHGYGLNQFLSPITNKRTDMYGKDLAGRILLLSEIVSQIKREIPEFLISVRYPGQDFLEGGLSISDSLLGAKKLQALGLDLLNVSSGIGGWRRPRGSVGEGYLAQEAAYFQKELNIPVIAVGGIASSHYIDRGLDAGNFSMAAVGRAILNGPLEWGQRNLS